MSSSDADKDVASLQRDAFLFCLAQSGNITICCEFAGLEFGMIASWRDSDASFDRAVRDAFRQAGDRLLFAARQRALIGHEEPRFYHGEQIATIRKPSDGLLRFLIACHAMLAGDVASSHKDDSGDRPSYEAMQDRLARQIAALMAGDDTADAPASSEECQP